MNSKEKFFRYGSKEVCVRLYKTETCWIMEAPAPYNKCGSYNEYDYALGQFQEACEWFYKWGWTDHEPGSEAGL